MAPITTLDLVQIEPQVLSYKLHYPQPEGMLCYVTCVITFAFLTNVLCRNYCV